MDTSLKLPNVQATAVTAAAPARPAPQASERAAERPEADVTVTISAAARVAERADVAATRVDAPRTRAEAVATGSPDAAAPADRAPDAASVASRPAVQLYLDNANRPATQPAVSPLRASA